MALIIRSVFHFWFVSELNLDKIVILYCCHISHPYLPINLYVSFMMNFYWCGQSTHLPPGFIFIIVADVSGFGEQRAGERRQLPSLWTQDAGAANPQVIYWSVAVGNSVGAPQRRVVRTRATCERRGKRTNGKRRERRWQERRRDGVKFGSARQFKKAIYLWNSVPQSIIFFYSFISFNSYSSICIQSPENLPNIVFFFSNLKTQLIWQWISRSGSTRE